MARLWWAALACRAALAAGIGLSIVVAPASAETPSPPGASGGRYVLTGGDLPFAAPRPPRRTAAIRRAPAPNTDVATDTPIDWLYDFVDLVLGNNPVTAGKPTQRRNTPRLARPGRAPVQPAALVAVPKPTEPTDGTSAITTSALVLPKPGSSAPEINRDDLDTDLIREAERAQAKQDLIKLELANRTYDEQRPAGSLVFQLNRDWRVLERGREAMTSTERSVADTAGFEGNVYINDELKLIVVAIAGTQDLKRDFLHADIWKALIQAEAPQQFFLAKSYIRSVIGRYQSQGYSTECVGHSLGGGACAYAASELNIRGIVINPISAGTLTNAARMLVTNYVIDGDIANYVYSKRGNEIAGDIQKIKADRDAVRQRVKDRYGLLGGPILVIRDMRDAVRVHQIERALDLIAAHAGGERMR